MNQEMRDYLMQALAKGIRADGRKTDQYREIEIELDVIKTAEGSARVKFGDSEVLAGVKMALEKPYPDTPDQGVLMVGAELLPLSNPAFESGPPSAKSVEIARVIDRGIRESKAIDTKSLCITPGEKVWSVIVDVCPLNTDGNLIDIGAFAAMLALTTARFPGIDEHGKVDYKHRTDKKVPLQHVPLSATIIKIGSTLLIDPTDGEEEALDARLTVNIREDGKICALQKGGDHPLSQKDLKAMLDLAEAKISELRRAFDKHAKI